MALSERASRYLGAILAALPVKAFRREDAALVIDFPDATAPSEPGVLSSTHRALWAVIEAAHSLHLLAQKQLLSPQQYDWCSSTAVDVLAGRVAVDAPRLIAKPNPRSPLGLSPDEIDRMLRFHRKFASLKMTLVDRPAMLNVLYAFLVKEVHGFDLPLSPALRELATPQLNDFLVQVGHSGVLPESPELLVLVAGVFSERSAIIDRLYNTARRYKFPHDSEPAAKSQSGCFVASAVFDDRNSPPVRILRTFRDTTLQRYLIGRWFVHVYETIGPALARFVGARPWLRRLLRRLLVLLCERLPDEKSPGGERDATQSPPELAMIGMQGERGIPVAPDSARLSPPVDLRFAGEAEIIVKMDGCPPRA